jgi:hypothetical protein
MRRILFVVGILLSIPLSTLAQETPSVEVSGGYSYVRFDGVGNLHGWNGSVAGNINDWLGIVGDFGGTYGSIGARVAVGIPIPGGNGGLSAGDVFPAPQFEFGSDISLYTFLVGPRFSYRRSERATPFVHVLIGGVRARFETTVRIATPAGTTTISAAASDNGPGAVFGGGLDLKLSRRLALRVIQADYLLTGLGDSAQSNARISAGLVFRFGER